MCLFSNQLSNSRFSSPSLCLAPGGHLWLLQPSDCATVHEQKRLGQTPKKKMLTLLSPKVLPNPHLSLALIYEEEITLEEGIFQNNFRIILNLMQYFLWKERLWSAQTHYLPCVATTATTNSDTRGWCACDIMVYLRWVRNKWDYEYCQWQIVPVTAVGKRSWLWIRAETVSPLALT